MAKIALCQINSTVGDLKGNQAKITEFAKRAAAENADIAVFPELALTGYPPEDLLLKRQFIEDNLTQLKILAKFTKTANVPMCIVGFADKDRQGRVYNAAAAIHKGKITGIYHKRHLPNYGVFDEMRYFTPGDKNLILNFNPPLTNNPPQPSFTKGGGIGMPFRKGGLRGIIKIGVTICEDIWVSNGITEELRKAKVDCVINLSASPYHAGKIKERINLIKNNAKTARAPLVYCNLVGGQDELVFDGGSMAISPNGKILAIAKQFKEDIVVFDVPPQAGTAHFFTPLPIEEEIWRALVTGARDYVRKNGFSGVAIGLSGGIDSAITAAIAVEALGREAVTGVTMPSRYTSRETLNDAELIAKKLGIKLLALPIEAIFKTFLETLAGAFGDKPQDVTEENLQARIRGILLMALSNKFGWLVLTTGNKSETSAGYCTLYGDTAGGFAVIKDVPKTMVYRLARHINNKAGRDIIPESIIVRPPTAELRPNQTDQDTLPPYELLDEIITAYVEENIGLKEIINQGIDENVARRIIRLIDVNEYKRRQAPPGVKITPRAFGKDRRMPITNKYRQ